MSKHSAPDRLEILRSFVNTWALPNDTRVPEDFIKTEGDIINFFLSNGLPEDTEFDLGEVKAFRKDLREAIEEQNGESLLHWLTQYPVQAALNLEENALKVQFVPNREKHLISLLIRIIVEAAAYKQWERLKACPDCKFVFYDNSKNGSKKWCGMYAGGPKGRACGTINKVRRYRERNKD